MSALRLALLAAVLTAAAAAPAAHAAPKALGAYAYFQPVTGDETYVGQIVVVLRTDRGMALDAVGNPRATARIRGITTYGYTISRNLSCYGYALDVRKGEVRVGDRIRVRLGKDDGILDRAMTVRSRAPGLPRGQRLGCGEDPASKAVIFNITVAPLVEPGRFFFSANSGPYLKNVRWRNWGAATATATATYISDCASCDEATYPVTVTASDLVPCSPYGARAYGTLAYRRSDAPAGPDERDRLKDLGEFRCD